MFDEEDGKPSNDEARESKRSGSKNGAERKGGENGEKGPEDPKGPKGVNFRSSRLLFLLIFVGVLVAVVAGMSPQVMRRTDELEDWTEFRKLVEGGSVSELRKVGREYYGVYASGRKAGKEGNNGFHITGPERMAAPDPVEFNRI